MLRLQQRIRSGQARSDRARPHLQVPRHRPEQVLTEVLLLLTHGVRWFGQVDK